MKKLIQQGLEQMGDTSNIKEMLHISGGDINKAFYVQTTNQEYFIKANRNVPSHFFRVEAKGLQQIKESNTIKVPSVFHYDEPKENEDALLIMEWIDGEKKKDTEERLGSNLAAMHKTYAEAHGFGEDTFIGSLPQPNGWYDQWVDYYHDARLVAQFNTAAERDRLPIDRKQRMKKLMDRLPKWINHDVKPSLLHGDLWGGNWMCGPGGEPYLIDPSIFYGDHAFELAFTELFGGYSETFYRTYQEHYPLPDHYEDIKPLYQLYYLLAHLNLFGETYGSSVDRILKRYVG